MSNLSFAQWYRTTGTLRVSLLVLAILGRVLLYIFRSPYYLSKDALILPFPLLLVLDVAQVVVVSILVVEGVRIIAYRSTSSWSLKKHFAIVFAFFAALAIFNGLFIPPKASIDYYNYGWSLVKEKDYKQALLSLNIAVMYNPRNVSAYFERGYAHRELGNLSLALDDYNKVLEMDSKNADGYEGRAYVYYYLSDCPNALKDWETAISLDPQKSIKLDKWIKAVRNDS